MAKIIVHGIPHGQQISECDKDLRAFFDIFYAPHKPGITKHFIRRKNNDVIYSYIVYENPGKQFSDFYGRKGSYFGISLVFHNEFVTDQNAVFGLLQATYDNYVKNQIISEDTNGTRKWMTPSIISPDDKIATFVADGIIKTMRQKPEYSLDGKIKPLPPIQPQNQRY